MTRLIRYEAEAHSAPDALAARAFEACPACQSWTVVRLAADWNDGRVLPVIACGNPWHYIFPATPPASAELRDWLRHKAWCNCKTDDPPDTERCKCGLRAALDDFRDRHERAFRDHILEAPEDHVCDDLCSDAIVGRLTGGYRGFEYPLKATPPASAERLEDRVEAMAKLIHDGFEDVQTHPEGDWPCDKADVHRRTALYVIAGMSTPPVNAQRDAVVEAAKAIVGDWETFRKRADLFYAVDALRAAEARDE